MNLTEDQKEQVKSLKGMIQSCFTYGGADKEHYNYERYIKPHEEKMGRELFSIVYNNELQNLKLNYEVKTNVYQDAEGLNYSSLVAKN